MNGACGLLALAVSLSACSAATLPYKPESPPPGGAISADYMILIDRLRVEIDTGGYRLEDVQIVKADGAAVRPQTIEHPPPGGSSIGLGIGMGGANVGRGGGVGVGTGVGVGVHVGGGSRVQGATRAERGSGSSTLGTARMLHERVRVIVPTVRRCVTEGGGRRRAGGAGAVEALGRRWIRGRNGREGEGQTDGKTKVGEQSGIS